MAKINLAILYGRIEKQPVISYDNETKEYHFGMAYLDTVRSYRKVEDKKHYVPHEYPMLLTREPAMIERMADWKVNDIVLVKGVVHTAGISKRSNCPFCNDADGNPTVNMTRGTLVTVEPIYVQKLKSYDDKKKSIEDVVANKEISNMVEVYGTLLKDPKIYTTKKGLHITQYPVAMNRKFTIRMDDPSIRTDYPIVKSYGEQALNDRMFLKYQAEVIVDGYLQARNVRRKVICPACGKYHIFNDRMMEIVPYAVEYVSGYLTPDDIEESTHKSAEELRQELFDRPRNDILESDMVSDDIKADMDAQDADGQK